MRAGRLSETPTPELSESRPERSESRPGAALPSERPANAPAFFHALVKPSGPICNLDCTYCFFLAKEELYPGDSFRMDDEVLDAYIRQLIESSNSPEVDIAFQGGEPTLMGADFFRRAVEIAGIYAKAGQRIRYSIQTNGTLLTDDICGVFADNGFLVGISIDGPAEIHDRFRVNKRGEPTHEKVMAGLRLLEKHGVEFNVLCTVNAANEAYPVEVYRYLRDEVGARHIQFIPVVEPVVEPAGAGVAGRAARDAADGADGADGAADGADGAVSTLSTVNPESVSPEGWGKFITAVFDEWLSHDVGEVFMNHFESALAGWVGVAPSLCIFGETCGNAVIVEHNGDVYACDHFVDPDHLVGNLVDTHLVELMADEKLKKFGDAKRDQLPNQCRECEYLRLCRGECPKNRLVATADGEEELNYLCAGYFAYFAHTSASMRLIADLVRAGQPASDVYQVFASAPRNGPCPCGSGRKAKQCHQRVGATA